MHALDLGACLLTLVATVYLITRHRTKRPPFPPGPPGWPILGNAFDFSPSEAWIKFTEWKAMYGDLVGLNVFGRPILVLNSQKAIADLLDKRGYTYSHRPVYVAAGELMGFNKSMVLMEYGPEWRFCRKLEHVALNASSVKQYETMQEAVAATLARDIIDNPDEFYGLVTLCAARIVLAVTYGLSAPIMDKTYIIRAEKSLELLAEAVFPGAYLCDLLPFLKHLPRWVPFQRRAAHGKQMLETHVDEPYQRVKMEMASGEAGPSLCRDLLTEGYENGIITSEMEERIKWTAGSMYLAGGETTFAATLVFIVAMANNAEIQKKAQDELDAVIGMERLPRLSDRGSLPYVEALIKEVMRWHPILPISEHTGCFPTQCYCHGTDTIAPTGVPRRTARDDVYEGYLVPKNTVVMPNNWQIAFEKNPKYPPEEFMPERFLDKDCPTRDPSTWAFGYGRRICPGKLLGESNSFIVMATLLATFSISSPSGEPLVPEYETHLMSMPKRFKCKFTPRSAMRVDQVRAVAL